MNEKNEKSSWHTQVRQTIDGKGLNEYKKLKKQLANSSQTDYRLERVK